ncbi:V-type ATP synthase subunit I [Halobacteriales archaeon QS_1_69_70]|nr:MAG: V-type ATP synthase subunit I [Halobacteriales archaeon QS_1_69_70]
MLRPERMSRVSVTGSKRVMDEAVETIHDLNLLDVTDYDGSWEGFSPGDPVEGADEAARKLVTVRALQSTLEVTDDDAGRVRILDDDELDAELERSRERVTDLDDERSALEDERREIDEKIETARPFAELGIDLDLLSGYDAISTAVGEGNEDELRGALAESEEVEAFETFAEGEYVALFVAPAIDVDDALVGTPFTRYEVPALAEVEATSPAAYVDELRSRRAEVASKLETVEHELEDLKHDVADFLLAAEEKLSIEVQKREAPLQFATTDNAFVSEGWIPADRYADLAEALQSALGDHVAVEELERADYREGEFVGDHGESDQGDSREPGVGEAVAADGAGDRAVRADGGHAGDVAMSDGEPPIEQDNPSGVEPFELLTGAVGKPDYTELDPTIVLFLTFPLMFGFMIGDIGYGIIYTGMGYWMIKNLESETFEDFGKVAAAAGLSTVFFGVLYGEVFGLHLDALPLISEVYGHAIIEKGLSPASVEWAQAWFVITALFGVFHLNLAWTFEFIEEYTFHGARAAVEEVGSWLLMLNGLWLYVFSRMGAPESVGGPGGPKPALLYTVFDGGENAAFELGFAGLPIWTGWIGVALIGVGVAVLAVGPTHELIEAHQVLAHVLSYLRIAAVLLAKAGMAFAVNLLFFGAYEHHGEFHFLLDHGPGWAEAEYGAEAVMFPGLMHGGAGALLAGVVVLLVGHVVVLLLGITAAGIQSIRLEYFEYFSKFYEGGGDPYSPFGHDRRFTSTE